MYKRQALDNVELEITDEALHVIAQKAIKLKSGARGLRSIVEQILMETMYEVPSDPTIIKVTVNADAAQQTAKPRLEYGAVRKRYKNVVNSQVH